jgi:hypothetical protein
LVPSGGRADSGGACPSAWRFQENPKLSAWPLSLSGGGPGATRLLP